MPVLVVLIVDDDERRVESGERIVVFVVVVMGLGAIDVRIVPTGRGSACRPEKQHTSVISLSLFWQHWGTYLRRVGRSAGRETAWYPAHTVRPLRTGQIRVHPEGPNEVDRV